MNWKSTAALAALGMLLGCNTHKGAYVPVTEPQAAVENRETVVLLDEKLADVLAVEGQQARYSDDGRLQVFANLRNRSDQRVTVQVQTVFKDENGYSTGDETGWDTLIIPELSQHSYQTVAQNSKARRYTIRIKTVH